MGYSTSVSDDGDTVAFGAPTDSMNLFEDTNVWYKGKNSWSSYTNAGAVRIFESRKYYPHSGVVEFTRFGNLDKSMHKTERDLGYYDQMDLYFSVDNIPATQTEFEEIEIPTDAGLAFIITPELDSASDEIIDNIKQWLALGDRTLVLVGNDPVYEENGLYRDSNKIIHKILKKLGSRMRIHPADTKYESLPDCADVLHEKVNVTKAYTPAYSHTSHIWTNNDIYARGVGDIRIDLSDLDLEDVMQFSPCELEKESINDHCNLPIKHDGDLRAAWNARCNLGKSTAFYEYNWPFHFANTNPSQVCEDYPTNPQPLINRPQEDIVPLMTAAEIKKGEYWYIPEEHYEGYSYEKDIHTPQERTGIDFKFADVQLDQLAFSVVEDDDSNVEVYPEETTFNVGSFNDPDKVNGRDALLQATAKPFKSKDHSYEIDNIRSPDTILALQERYFHNSNGSNIPTDSTVTIIASTLCESRQSLGAETDLAFQARNMDQNVYFYVNLVMKDCNTVSHVAQLGGWTKRDSFKAAYPDSYLQNVLTEKNIIVTENAQYGQAGSNRSFIPDGVDVVWIADPLGRPDGHDIDVLKLWLNPSSNVANKKYRKLIITYSADPHASNEDGDQVKEILDNVTFILEELNITSKLVTNLDGTYFIDRPFDVTYQPGLSAGTPVYGGTQIVNTDLQAIQNCGGYDFVPWHKELKARGRPKYTGVDWFVFYGDTTTYHIVPILAGTDPEREVQRIVHYDTPLIEKVEIIPERQYIEAESTAVFPVLPGTGYRIFINYVSETKYENVELDYTLSPLNTYPSDLVFDTALEQLVERSASIPIARLYIDPGSQPKPEIKTESFDFRATENELTLDFDTFFSYRDRGGVSSDRMTEGIVPKTLRILSISGCPIEVVKAGLPYTVDEVTWETIHVPPSTSPASSGYSEDYLRPIMHSSTEYCNPDNENCSELLDIEIEDGPVVVAEEFEHFSSFVNGNERSRIVVISDSTIIQGQCPNYRNNSLGGNQEFIRSLYPTSPRVDKSAGGRHFEFTQKLRAPEKGSPAKYFAASGLVGTAQMFGTGVYGNLDTYVDNEDTYHPANPGFIREDNPDTEDEKEAAIRAFMKTNNPYNVFPRFSGDFLNTGSYVIGRGEEQSFLLDADSVGGLPDLMKLNGTDYLDFDLYNSGCPGDLFGYSVDITENKLVVGTPFNAFHVEEAINSVSGLVTWTSVSGDDNPSRSGMRTSVNGGAGAAFYFERTGSGTDVVSEYLPWEYKQKIKPNSVNVGLDCTSSCVAALQVERGDHNLDGTFIIDNATRTDQFGHSVTIDSDMMAIGAPNHDFETLHHHIYEGSGAFLRKDFNAEFTIPKHAFYDLGSSGVRIDQFGSNSGTMVLNNGAVFSYRHEMVDWPTRTQEWQYAEKLNSQGYNDRSQGNPDSTPPISGCENDFFGRSVAIDRAKRDDSDYTLVVGAPSHDFATSGNHTSEELLGAGAAYTYDAMLREQIPSIPNSGSFIDIEVFGHRSNSIDKIKTRVYQNTSGDSITYYTTGVVFANSNGDVFLEGSGFDPSTKGFIAHRPYVESVIGSLLFGTPSSGFMPLITSGMPVTVETSGISLYTKGPDSAIVYNNMGLYSTSWTQTQAGSGTDPLLLTVSGLAPIDDSGIMNMSVSGSIVTTDNLNLRVRGY